LIGFQCADALQADFGFADCKRVAVDDVGLAGDRLAGICAASVSTSADGMTPKANVCTVICVISRL
jgi:hypothetical protein